MIVVCAGSVPIRRATHFERGRRVMSEDRSYVSRVIWLMLAGSIVLHPGGAQAARAPLSGMWGGDRAVLTLTAEGGRLEFDCGYATLSGPVALDRRGRFKAAGVYYPESGGPVDADVPPVQLAARFNGTVSGSNLHLNFKQSKGAADRAFDMVAGKRQKLIRCL